MTEIVLSVFVLTMLIIALALLILLMRNQLVPKQQTVITLNGARELSTQTGQKLLTALIDNAIMVPSVCAGAGTCGLCKVTLVGSTEEVSPIERAKLSAAEIRDGTRLACQVTIREPLALSLPDSLLGAESTICTVVSTRALTPLIREITFQFPDGKWPDVIAGDYIQIEAPPYNLDFSTFDVPDEHQDTWKPVRQIKAHNDKTTSRAYSISNRLEDTQARRLVLNIRLALPPPANADVPPGIVSSWLFSLKQGDTAKATGPFGSFRAQETGKEMVLIGGGVGMAPLRAIIHEQLEVQKTKRKMSFWFGARNRAELFYADELDALAKKYSNFSWTASLSEPSLDEKWQGPVGFIHSVALDSYLKDHTAPEDCEYYLCGPPLMMRAVQAMLDDLGVEPDSIFFDDFGV